MKMEDIKAKKVKYKNRKSKKAIMKARQKIYKLYKPIQDDYIKFFKLRESGTIEEQQKFEEVKEKYSRFKFGGKKITEVERLYIVRKELLQTNNIKQKKLKTALKTIKSNKIKASSVGDLRYKIRKLINAETLLKETIIKDFGNNDEYIAKNNHLILKDSFDCDNFCISLDIFDILFIVRKYNADSVLAYFIRELDVVFEQDLKYLENLDVDKKDDFTWKIENLIDKLDMVLEQYDRIDLCQRSFNKKKINRNSLNKKDKDIYNALCEIAKKQITSEIDDRFIFNTSIIKAELDSKKKENEFTERIIRYRLQKLHKLNYLNVEVLRLIKKSEFNYLTDEFDYFIEVRKIATSDVEYRRPQIQLDDEMRYWEQFLEEMTQEGGAINEQKKELINCKERTRLEKAFKNITSRNWNDFYKTSKYQIQFINS